MQRSLLLPGLVSILLASCASNGGTRWEPTVGLGLQTWGNHSEEVQLSSAETALAGRASVDRDVAELTFGVTHSTVAGEAIRKDWFAGVKLALGELDSSDRFNFGGDGENVDELALGGMVYLTDNATWTPYASAWGVFTNPASPNLDTQTSLALGTGVELAMGPQFALYSELNYLVPLSDSDAKGTLPNLAGDADLPASGTRDYSGLALMFGIRARIGLTD